MIGKEPRHDLQLDIPDKAFRSQLRLMRFPRLLVLLVLGLVSPTLPAVELVANPSVSVHRIAKNSLRAIFGMRVRKWPDGEPITVYVLPDKDPIHAEFAKARLGVFPHQLRQAWDRQVFSGTGQAPTEVKDVEQMTEKLENTPGAIGYLPAVPKGAPLEVVRIQ